MKHYVVTAIVLAAIVSVATWQIKLNKDSHIQKNLAAVSATDVSVTAIPPACKTVKQITELTANVTRIQKEITALPVTIKTASSTIGSLKKQLPTLETNVSRAQEKVDANRAGYEKIIKDGEQYIAQQKNLIAAATGANKTNLQKKLNSYTTLFGIQKSTWNSMLISLGKATSTLESVNINLLTQEALYAKASNPETLVEMKAKLEELKKSLEFFKKLNVCPAKESLGDTYKQCSDKIDNDRDGTVDCNDTDCKNTGVCLAGSVRPGTNAIAGKPSLTNTIISNIGQYIGVGVQPTQVQQQPNTPSVPGSETASDGSGGTTASDNSSDGFGELDFPDDYANMSACEIASRAELRKQGLIDTLTQNYPPGSIPANCLLDACKSEETCVERNTNDCAYLCNYYADAIAEGNRCRDEKNKINQDEDADQSQKESLNQCIFESIKKQADAAWDMRLISCGCNGATREWWYTK